MSLFGCCRIGIGAAIRQRLPGQFVVT